MKKLAVLLAIVVSILWLTNVGLAYNLELKVFSSKGAEGVVESYTDNIILNITISYVNSFNISNLKIDDIPANLLGAECVEKDIDTQSYECSVNLGWLMAEKCENHYVYYGNDSTYKKIFDVCLDDKPPVVNKFFVAKKHITSSQDLVFSLDALDKSRVSSKCAGLKSVKLTFNTGSSYEMPLYGQSGICSFLQNNIAVPISSFSESDFESVNQVCLTVVDFFGKASEPVCENISVDDNPPEVKTEGFSLLTQDRQGVIGPYVQQNKVYTVVPFIEATDKSDQILLRGNFSIFENGENIYDFKNVMSSCEKTGESFKCYFVPFSFTLSHPESNYVLRYAIKAQDRSGNSANYEGTYDLFVDKTRPVVNEIKAITSIDEANYLTSGSTIAVYFYEEGCGFHNRNAYISSVAFGSKRADECYNENNEWICLFNDINPSRYYNEQAVNIAVTSNTKDDCNNSVESTTGKNFIIDLDKPNIVGEMNITNQDGELFIKEGDSVKIRFVAQDFSENLYVEANFSKVNGDDSIYRTECEKLDSKNFSCEIYISNAMECSEEVPLRIYDNANNSLYENVLINVYRRNENPSTDFWSIGEITISPDKIDRSLSEKLNLYAFADVEFKARANNQHMVSFEIEDCESDMNVEVIPLYQNDALPGSKTITFVIKIPAGTSIDEYSKDINCTFAIKTHRGQTVTVNPESEKVKFTLKFYDGSLGESRDAVFDKIKSKYEWVKGFNDLFGKHVLPIYKMVETGCSVYNTYSKATYAFDVTAIAVTAIPGVNAGVISAATDNNEVHKALTEALGKFCDGIQCSNTKEKVCNAIKASDFYIEGLTSCPDPTKNLILAIGNGCLWPAAINTLSQVYYIETARLGCYLNGVETGTPLYVCDNLASQYYCENILGGVIEGGLARFMPGVHALWSDIFNGLGLVAESLEDPLSAAISLTLTLSPLPHTYIIGVTKYLSSISDAINSIYQVQELTNQFKDFGEGYAAEVLAKYEQIFGDYEDSGYSNDVDNSLPSEDEEGEVFSK